MQVLKRLEMLIATMVAAQPLSAALGLSPAQTRSSADEAYIHGYSLKKSYELIYTLRTGGNDQNKCLFIAPLCFASVFKPKNILGRVARVNHAPMQRLGLDVHRHSLDVQGAVPDGFKDSKADVAALMKRMNSDEISNEDRVNLSRTTTYPGTSALRGCFQKPQTNPQFALCIS